MYVSKIHLVKVFWFCSNLGLEAHRRAVVLNGLRRFLDSFDSALLGAFNFSKFSRQELWASTCCLLSLLRPGASTPANMLLE